MASYKSVVQIKKCDDLRKFASGSLDVWLNNLYHFCDSSTKIVLFGKTKDINCDGTIITRNTNVNGGGELIKLLLCSVIQDGKAIITNHDQGTNSIYDKILNDFDGNIYIVPHPAFY